MRSPVRADGDGNRVRGRRVDRAFAAAVVALIVVGLLSVPSLAWPQSTEPAPRAAAPHGTPGAQAAGALRPEDAADVSEQPIHGEPAWIAIARLVNFAILVGVLVYYLRAPISNYLARRSTEIRSDLVTAAETRQAAEAELASIDQKLKALPAEIEALKERGAAEIAAEEARIRQAADSERARLLDQARREIDLQLRVAERELVKRAAELTVGLASDRIKRTINDEDQKRLVDLYLSQIRK